MAESPLRAILFDLDGTLADTEPLWIRSKARVADNFGIDWSSADNLASVGQPTRVYSLEFVRRGARATPEQVAEAITMEVVRGLEDGISWRPGALSLLAEAVNAEMSTALVTMSYRAIAEAVARATGLPVFDVIVAGEDVTSSKPHPEPYRRALELLGLSPAEAVAVEDTETGAASAEGAGIRTLLVSRTTVGSLSERWTLPSLEGVGLAELSLAAARQGGQGTRLT